MDEDNRVVKASSLMYMIVSIMLIWCAFYTLNQITNIFEISIETYHISITVMTAFLIVFFLYMVYRGLIAESMIAIMIMFAIGSYSVATVIGWRLTDFAVDPVVIMTGLIPIIVIAMDRKRIPLAIGCALTLLGCHIGLGSSDDYVITIKFAVMLAAGIIFGVWSCIAMYRALRNLSEPRTTGIALNATAMCETIGYAILGTAMIYSTILSNMYFISDPLLPKVILVMAVNIALVIGVYSALNGSISSGTTIITIASMIFLISYTNDVTGTPISPFVCTILGIPLLFTAYRFHRKGDRILMIVALLTIVCMVFRCTQGYNNDFALRVITMALVLFDAILMEYVALSRTLYVETGTKRIPLYDGDSFVNEEEPWNRRFQPRPKDRDNTIGLQTYLMMSIGLLLLGAYYINLYYGTFTVNAMLFHVALLIVSSLVIVFSMENLVKGRLTETIGAILVGTFLLSYSMCGLMDLEHLTDMDIVPALGMLVCGLVFLLHKGNDLGIAFICTSAAIMLALYVPDDATIVFTGILLLVAGAILMIRYNYQKLIKRKPNATITECGSALDDVTLSRLARTLAVLLLGLVTIMLALSSDTDIKIVLVMCVMSGINTVVCVYGLMKDDAPGFVVLFGMSLLTFVVSLCFLITDNVKFDLVLILFAMIMVPVLLVFLRRGKYISVVISLLLLSTLLLKSFTAWKEAGDVMAFIAGMLLCLLALYNWLVHEGLMKPWIDPKLFGFSVNKR